MRARALAAAALLLLGGSLAAHAGASVDIWRIMALRLVPVAGPPPPLSLKRLDDGRTLTLGDLAGRPVLLYFWATW